MREKHPGGHDPASRLCPFWREGKCTERERRPLGCRTHFCDTRYRDQLEAIHERHLGRIRAIANEQSLPWDYGEFVKAIRSPGGGAPSGDVTSDSKERPVRAPGLQKTRPHACRGRPHHGGSRRSRVPGSTAFKDGAAEHATALEVWCEAGEARRHQ